MLKFVSAISIGLVASSAEPTMSTLSAQLSTKHHELINTARKAAKPARSAVVEERELATTGTWLNTDIYWKSDCSSSKPSRVGTSVNQCSTSSDGSTSTQSVSCSTDKDTISVIMNNFVTPDCTGVSTQETVEYPTSCETIDE